MGKKKQARQIALVVAALISNGSIATGSGPQPGRQSRGNGSQGDPGGHLTATGGSNPAPRSAFDARGYDAYGQADAGLDTSSPKALRAKADASPDLILRKGYMELADRIEKSGRPRIAANKALAAEYWAKHKTASDPLLREGYKALALEAEGA